MAKCTKPRVTDFLTVVQNLYGKTFDFLTLNKNDINFKPILSAAGMAEWIGHSTLDQRDVGSEPPSDQP